MTNKRHYRRALERDTVHGTHATSVDPRLQSRMADARPLMPIGILGRAPHVAAKSCRCLKIHLWECPGFCGVGYKAEKKQPYSPLVLSPLLS